MDKNTTTGLILIGAVVIAFMYLNKPQEPQKTEQVVTSKSKNKENFETEIDEPVTENKSEISNIETLDSNDLVIYQKLKEQKIKEDLIERYGVFFTSAEGTEEILEIQNNKIKLSFSSRGGRITSASISEIKRVNMTTTDSSLKNSPIRPSKNKKSEKAIIVVIIADTTGGMTSSTPSIAAL